MAEYIFQEETIKSLADALRYKTNKTENMSVEEMTRLIYLLNISSGQGVTFYDYDGTALYSYSIEEAQALSALPEAPTHEDVTTIGWTYSLEDVNNLTLASNIGAMYESETTQFTIETVTTDTAVPLTLNQSEANGVSVDWGDGSETETIDGAGSVTLSHTYPASGQYKIKLSLISGTLGLDASVFGDDTNITSLVKKVIVGKNVTTLSNAFNGYANLETALLSYGELTTVGASAFNGCSNLRSIVLPSQITSIGSYAFQDCAKLTSIVFSPNIASIYVNAFRRCTSLMNLVIPSQTTNINNFAFCDCSALESITVDNNNTKYRSVGNCLLNVTDNSLILGCKNSKIPDDGSVTSIASFAFSNCFGLTEIIVPDSITKIGNGAFSDCIGLQDITLPFIGNKETSFSSGVHYPFGYIFDTGDSVGTTQTQQYLNNNGLNSVTYDIPTNLTHVTLRGYVQKYAFYNCKKLTHIDIQSNGNRIGDYAFWNCSSVTQISLPDTIKFIGESAFYGCSKLQSMNIPSNLVLLDADLDRTLLEQEDSGVYYWSNSDRSRHILTRRADASTITNLVVKDNTQAIASEAFYNCDTLQNVTFSEGLMGIGSKAFAGCDNLSSIELPGSVIQFGNYVFSDCTNLSDVKLSSGIQHISYNMFSRCHSLTNVTIPDSVTSIGDAAFYNCISLININIPNSVKTIGNQSFYSCNGLTSVTMPDSVTSIGQYAFSGCGSLTSVTIGNGVKSIGKEAFYGCTTLTSAVYQGTAEEWAQVTVGTGNENLTNIITFAE